MDRVMLLYMTWFGIFVAVERYGGTWSDCVIAGKNTDRGI